MISGVSEAYKAKMFAPEVTIYSRIELLDKNEVPIERIDSRVRDGHISVDGNADVQRTFSITLANRANRFTWGPRNLIWLDKRIKLYIGLETPSGIEYAPQGVFILDDPIVDSQTGTVTLQGGDKAKLFDGDTVGRLLYTTKIKAGTPVDQAIMQLARDGGEDRFAFEQCPITVPYDVTYQAGQPRLEAIKKLAEFGMMRWGYDTNGYQRLRAKTDPSNSPSVQTYSTRDRRTTYAGGQKSLVTREVFNVVVVIGGSAQTGIVRSVKRNDDPNHPLSTAKIGERIFFYNGGSPDPLITTQTLADNRAQWELDRCMRYIEKHRFTLVPNYLHEPFDVITIIDDGHQTNDRFELVSFDLPLGPGKSNAEAWRFGEVV